MAGDLVFVCEVGSYLFSASCSRWDTDNGLVRVYLREDPIPIAVTAITGRWAVLPRACYEAARVLSDRDSSFFDSVFWKRHVR